MNKAIFNQDVSVADRGFAYGDGLFETMAVVDAECPAWSYHIARLAHGCKILNIKLPDNIEDMVFEAATSVTEPSVLKLIVTRGIPDSSSSARGYTPSKSHEPTVRLVQHPWPNYPSVHRQTGIDAIWLDFQVGLQPALAGLKHLNRLEQVLAAAELADRSASTSVISDEAVIQNQATIDHPHPHSHSHSAPLVEGLLTDLNDRVICGSKTNIFIEKDGSLLTPDLSAAGIAGTMRAWVLEQAKKLAITVQIAELSRYDVDTADAVFVTNAIAGIWPVKRLGDNSYPVSNITKQLQAQLDQRLWPLYGP